jgi:hypothetical protein
VCSNVCPSRHWICRKCHENFVVPRSLDFIYAEDSGQPAGRE